VTVIGVWESKKTVSGVTVMSPVPGVSWAGSCDWSTTLSFIGDLARWP
jgi:hypothetical protein